MNTKIVEISKIVMKVLIFLVEVIIINLKKIMQILSLKISNKIKKVWHHNKRIAPMKTQTQ